MRFNVSLDVKNQPGIYKISNNVDNRIYIGRTTDFEKRFWQHYNKFKFNRCNRKFCSFLDSYPVGCLSFEIVEICNKSILKEREEFYIQFYNCVESGFNILTKDEDFIVLYPKKEYVKRKIERIERRLPSNRKKKKRKTKWHRFYSRHKKYYNNLKIFC